MLIMKRILILLSFIICISASASTSGSVISLDTIGFTPITPQALLNWKVGDSSDYGMKGVFGNMGNLHKEITKEEGNGVWMLQKLVAMGRNDVSELLIDRDSGKILKFIHNGKEETYPDEQIEVISQDYTSVTVPAGTFDAMHIVAKTKQVNRVEVWNNTRDVVIDGSIKQVMSTQFGDITLQLTQQHRAP